MKKILLMLTAVATLFTACTEECNHDFIEVDYNKDLVGTWTCLEADYAEALVISADGSVVSTGVEDGEYWDGVKGNIKTVNNKMTLTFEDDHNYEGRFEMLCGEAFSIFNENGEHLTYRYCANDLADEVIGMWVCNDAPNSTDNDMAIVSFEENGTSTLTGVVPNAESYMVTTNSIYKVVGDLLFQKRADAEGSKYITSRLIYSPNATTSGDIMTYKMYFTTENGKVESTSSWLRINQSLDLAGQEYDYIKTFVSNVKGQDKEIEFFGYTFNFAKMDGSGLDKMLKALLFSVAFPDDNTLSYSYQYNNNKEAFDAPIVVEGNMMTIKMSQKVPTLKDVVLYAFQDQYCSQMHFYMHKTAFVSFYTNMQAMLLAGTDEQFDITNAEAVNAIYDSINSAVETINVSLVMTRAAK